MGDAVREACERKGPPEDENGVVGSIAYLLPSSKTNRRYVSPAGCINFCGYTQHDVFIRDARRLVMRPTLDSHGFTLVEHASTLPDPADARAIEALYVPEIEDLVKRVTGADRVVTIAWMVRSSAKERGAAQPPSNDVHVDYTTELSEWMANMVLEKVGASASSFRRIMTVNAWRAVTAPPQDWPLCLCASESVRDDEGVPYEIHQVDVLPTTTATSEPEVLPEDPSRARSLDFAAFRFDEGHRWFYFPDMHPNEVLLFKNSDSDAARTQRVPHASFKDPTCPEVTPRQSIEVRTLVCFT